MVMPRKRPLPKLQARATQRCHQKEVHIKSVEELTRVGTTGGTEYSGELCGRAQGCYENSSSKLFLVFTTSTLSLSNNGPTTRDAAEACT